MACPTPLSMTAAARWLLGWPKTRVWLLRGNLGAGKTTLVRAALRHLGVRRKVASPTFGLVAVYPIRHPVWDAVVHVDAYRLRLAAEYAALGLQEWLDNPRALVMIEWPEKLGGQKFPPALHIRLNVIGQGRRLSVRRR